MNILVTGAEGFIGSHLYTHLAERGHTVTPIDKRHSPSTSDLDFLRWAISETRPDVIAHLGASCSTAVSLADPAADFHDNAIGTFNIAEAARQAGNIPVLFTSTVKVHPGADGKLTPLGQSKLVGEQYLRLYRDLYALPSVILRPSTVYGPGQSGTAEAGWVTWFLRAFLNRQPITIHGDGSQSRDILHIGDMTRLLVDICEHFDAYQRAEPYDVGGGPDNELSLNDLLNWLEYTNITHDQRLPGDLQHVVTDNSAISAIRGWVPNVPWQRGAHLTMGWMRRHP